MEKDEICRRLQVKVKQGANDFHVDLMDYLGLIGLKSIDEISAVETSMYFPPTGKYTNSGRTAGGMPDNYAPFGSGSAVINTTSSQERALSIALFHDITEHGGKPPHVNAYIYGWPVKIVSPDYSKDLPNGLHTLRGDDDIEIKLAEGTLAEKRYTLKLPL